MKHFYCDFRVQHLSLHKNWHISFLLALKSEILYISVIHAGVYFLFNAAVNFKTYIAVVIDEKIFTL